MDYPDFCINPDIDHEVKNTVESEAIHVSAAALTRLAKEAAEALAYLAKRRYVHRDVRAANCLIDANRSLKLADFGMHKLTSLGFESSCRVYYIFVLKRLTSLGPVV